MRINHHKVLTYCIAAIWLINGLFCKVLNLVPRHQQIVAHILGAPHSRLLTVLIGLSETGMAVWIISGIKSRVNATMQIIIIGIMNALEFFLVPDLLLWGEIQRCFCFAVNDCHLLQRISPQQKTDSTNITCFHS